MNMKKSLLALSTAAAVALSGTAVAGAQEASGMMAQPQVQMMQNNAAQAAKVCNADNRKDCSYKESFNLFLGLNRGDGLVQQVEGFNKIFSSILHMMTEITSMMKSFADLAKNLPPRR